MTETLTETLSGTKWMETPDPATGTDGFLDGVSCSDKSLCVAVGDVGSHDPNSRTTLVLSGSVYQPGYDLVGTDGGVFAFPVGQSSGYYGSLPGLGIHVDDIVGIIAAPDGGGYLLVAADGGVFAFGPQGSHLFQGSLLGEGVHVDDIVGIAATGDGGGYWLVSSDGKVYPFGDASAECPSCSDLPNIGVNVSNIVSIATTPDSHGYWLIGSDGGVFPFGDAVPFEGSLPGLGISVHNIVGAVQTG
jgi:hypothetical protein